MKSEEQPVLVRVFTHPVCTSCHYAIELAEQVARERSDLDVRIVSLANQRGLEEARVENVLSVPTVIVGQATKRFVGLPGRDEFLKAIDAEKKSQLVKG